MYHCDSSRNVHNLAIYQNPSRKQGISEPGHIKRHHSAEPLLKCNDLHFKSKSSELTGPPTLLAMCILDLRVAPIPAAAQPSVSVLTRPSVPAVCPISF